MLRPLFPSFLFRHNGEDIKAETSVPSDKSQKTSCRDYSCFLVSSVGLFMVLFLSGFGSAVDEIVCFPLMKLKIWVSSLKVSSFFGTPTTINYKLRQNLIAVINLLMGNFSFSVYSEIATRLKPLQSLSGTSLIDLAI